MTLQERFEDKIFYSPDGCWYWTGSLSPSGYGRIAVNRRNEKAYRLSYQLFKGYIPEGGHVLHCCDTRACVNPNHLRIGTHEDNMKDKKERGRSHNIPKGEKSPISKLTDKQVIEIRELAKTLKPKEVCKKLGLPKSRVNMVLYQKVWTHLPMYKGSHLHTFTEYEADFIRDNSLHMSVNDIAKHLGISPRGVRNFKTRRKLTKQNVYPKTPC